MNKSEKFMTALEQFLESAQEKHLAFAGDNEWEKRKTSDEYSNAYQKLRKVIQEVLPE